MLKKRVRIRPGGILIIPPMLLRTLGNDPKKLVVELTDGRLFLSRRLSPQQARLARFKARLEHLKTLIDRVRA